ncbi:hypothetical protein VTK26DRAFT_4237 [Humicola hyalothermophila]
MDEMDMSALFLDMMLYDQSNTFRSGTERLGRVDIGRLKEERFPPSLDFLSYTSHFFSLSPSPPLLHPQPPPRLSSHVPKKKKALPSPLLQAPKSAFQTPHKLNNLKRRLKRRRRLNVERQPGLRRRGSRRGARVGSRAHAGGIVSRSCFPFPSTNLAVRAPTDSLVLLLTLLCESRAVTVPSCETEI